MSSADLKKAAQVIKDSGVVAFPTETVYGLGADARSEEACQKIFKIKGRPSINPLIVHISNLHEAEKFGEFNGDVYKLTKEFWPGPLSVVLPLKNPSPIAPCVLAGNLTIALRVPSHPIARALIRAAECPVAAPSANPSGYISSTLNRHVVEHFGESEVFILKDETECEYGLESTIIDLSVKVPAILRYGFITPEAIENLLGKHVAIANSLMQMKAPGMLEKHYSPHTSIRLNATSVNDNEIALNFGNSNLTSIYSLNLSKNSDLIEAAANLYKMLRELDEHALKNKIDTIAVAEVPNIGIGLALNDRLKRAAHSL